jgi:hypothetical protein
VADERLRELLEKRQTSGLTDDEAAELGTLLADAPRRPDQTSRQATQQGWPKAGKPWERGWAIVGIAFGFLFLLTIPGWIGLDHSS